MPALGLVTKSLVGPGTDQGPGAPTVFAEGLNVSVVDDTVSPHGAAPHTKSIIKTGSGTVYANGKRVVVAQISVASCGHIVNTGARSVFVGS
jgi:uncharacterized Zn-binding protein involved in type VI secretion